MLKRVGRLTVAIYWNWSKHDRYRNDSSHWWMTDTAGRMSGLTDRWSIMKRFMWLIDGRYWNGLMGDGYWNGRGDWWWMIYEKAGIKIGWSSSIYERTSCSQKGERLVYPGKNRSLNYFSNQQKELELKSFGSLEIIKNQIYFSFISLKELVSAFLYHILFFEFRSSHCEAVELPLLTELHLGR